jgi:hypothetical protein
MEFRASDLESLLAEGHRARLVGVNVERQDLKRFYEGIRAVEGGARRSALAPEKLLKPKLNGRYGEKSRPVGLGQWRVPTLTKRSPQSRRSIPSCQRLLSSKQIAILKDRNRCNPVSQCLN